ncbi:MAG: hypothetical protein QME81_06605 [bacterium]|nr:hypothetical protein [bacterium]
METTMTIPKTQALGEILRAIDYLSPKEKGTLKLELERKARRELKQVMNEVRADNQQFSEEEIVQDVTEAIEEVRLSKRARTS